MGLANSTPREVHRGPFNTLWLRLAALLRPVSRGKTGIAANWRLHKTAGKKAFRAGDYTEAEKHFSTALKLVAPLGPENPRVAATLNNIALVYKMQGRFGKAEMCLRRALRIYEAVRPDHAHVATVMGNLAALYDSQGKHTEAEPLRKRAQAIIGAG
ncbi:MAG: tetratricopeptide repeat protein [Acidiferrobacterales bacterium]